MRAKTTKNQPSFTQLVLRPLNFVKIIATGLVVTFGLVFLLIIIFTKPYQQSQDIRQQAIERQECLSMTDLPRNECEALVTFYESTNGVGWMINNGEIPWFSTPRACEWVGITCTGNPNLEIPEPAIKNVVAITLQGKKLSGTLPLVWETFSQLVQIDLSHNTLLRGPLPVDFKNLQLNKLLTFGTGLCLPESLTSWYRTILNTDGLPLCTVVPPVIPPTTTPTPTRTTGTGTTNIVGCNQICQSNSNCSNSMRCYELGEIKRCRLATNPSSDVCQGIPDQGLNFACNEYCSDSSECAGDLTCWYNRCREAANVTSVSCTPPDSELRDLMQNNCGQTCYSNRDCVINMRCYYGSCRLATNPTSQTCSATSTIRSVTATPTLSQTKGGLGTTATPSAEASTSSIIVEPTQEVIALTPTSPLTELKLSPLDRLRSWFSQFRLPTFESAGVLNLLQSKGLLVGLVIAGVVLLLLGIFSGKKKNSPKSKILVTPPSIRSSHEHSTGMIDRIKQKGITPLK